LVAKCKLPSLWRAKLKPSTACIIIIVLIASSKALEISFIVGRLECASEAVHHLLGLLEITRRQELVGDCKLASLWRAKLKPSTACIIIIVLIASLKAQRSFIVWLLECARHAVHHVLGLLARARRHELVDDDNWQVGELMACKAKASYRMHSHDSMNS
jgi:hypothetical protein